MCPYKLRPGRPHHLNQLLLAQLPDLIDRPESLQKQIGSLLPDPLDMLQLVRKGPPASLLAMAESAMRSSTGARRIVLVISFRS